MSRSPQARGSLFPRVPSISPSRDATGFEIGQKIGIDPGGDFEVATVTAAGKSATQTTLAAAAAAGETSLKLAAGPNVAVGDTLTIGTGARKEVVKVMRVRANVVELQTPLKVDHALSVDVSGSGTGISFSPPTRFRHTSGDAVQALGSGITLDRPLATSHPYGAPIIGLAGSNAGYQGPPAPDQWFGSALSTRSGALALMDATGTVLVDAIVYGSRQSNSSANGTIPSPEIATLEGDQGKGGCIAVVRATLPANFNRSLGRYPDGADTGKQQLCRLTDATRHDTGRGISAAGNRHQYQRS